MVYDLKIVCPRLDRYWYFDHVQKAKQLQVSHELNSQRFLRGMQLSGPEADMSATATDTAKARPTSTEFIIEDGDGTLVRNFEWERRQGNFNPQEFGTEMNQMLG